MGYNVLSYEYLMFFFSALPFRVMGGNISDKLYGVNPQQIWRIKIFNFNTYMEEPLPIINHIQTKPNK